MRFAEIYKTLLREYGHQNWWPSKTKTQFEICAGAILTQNTNWGNVEKALDNLIAAKALSAAKIADMDIRTLQKLIRPSGFFRQKAVRLQAFAKIVAASKNFYKNITREGLLKMRGIGPETADSILLYACGRPYFVVDAYTRRIFSRIGIVDKNMDYEEIRNIFESNIPKDVELYKEFHALIVQHAKQCCRKTPNESCVLKVFIVMQ